MKKIIYLFLTVSLIFSSCKKEEGCMDSAATNYNADADEQDDASSCMYAISGYVWETTSIVLNGDALAGEELFYIFDDGSMGTETYDLNGNMLGYGTCTTTFPSQNVWIMTGSSLLLADQSTVTYSVTVEIDIMTNATNMTWRYIGYPDASSTYVKTLKRSTTYALSDFK
tara:strand:- start:104 stop:613 length:510 start_codon:yes stop_codon:yes gene_type:complete